jgi:sugar lactone lactonase YvrE
MKMVRVLAKAAAAAVVLTMMIGSLTAGAAAAWNRRAEFPTHIDLPKGFRPEGIAIKGTTFYTGSLANGAIFRGDVRTGEGAVIAGTATGTPAVGLAVDRAGRIFAAGGPSGTARVIDSRTGAVIKTYQFATQPTFINDVVIARGSAWFTDSQQMVLYRVPLDLAPHETVRLTGDIKQMDGFNVNGIDATENGKRLVLVQSNTGSLFTTGFDGVTTQIDLGGESVPNGDGILLEGRRLYVVQNQLNQVAVIKLHRDLSSGTVLTRLENEDFDIPTTIDRFGRRLYAVNARFSTPPSPDTAYWITAFPAGAHVHGHRDHESSHHHDDD